MERLTITVDEFARAFGVSKPTAYELVHTDNFTLIRVGRKMLIPIDGVKKWVEECGSSRSDLTRI